MGVVFISVIIGASIGLAVYASLVYFIYEPYTLKNGIGSPEFRLVPGIFAAALAPAGMFIFGYAAKEDISWVAPTVGIALYAACSFVLVNVIFVYLPISYPRYAASVFASNGKSLLYGRREYMSNYPYRFPSKCSRLWRNSFLATTFSQFGSWEWVRHSWEFGCGLWDYIYGVVLVWTYA
jgi:hypothetical protein